MYDKLINIRKEKGISSKKMAELIKMPIITYHIKEFGLELNNKNKKNTSKDFTLDEMVTISKILNVNPEDIFYNKRDVHKLQERNWIWKEN